MIHALFAKIFREFEMNSHRIDCRLHMFMVTGNTLRGRGLSLIFGPKMRPALSASFPATPGS